MFRVEKFSVYRGRPVTPGRSEVVANAGVRGWQGVPVRGVSGAMEQLWFLSVTKEDRDGHGVLARAAELVSIPTCPGGGGVLASEQPRNAFFGY